MLRQTIHVSNFFIPLYDPPALESPNQHHRLNSFNAKQLNVEEKKLAGFES